MRILQIILAILLLIATTSCTSESGRRARADRNQTAHQTDTTLIYTSPAGDKLYELRYPGSGYALMVQNCHGEIIELDN